jgi:hypothetical protein
MGSKDGGLSYYAARQHDMRYREQLRRHRPDRHEASETPVLVVLFLVGACCLIGVWLVSALTKLVP